MPCSEKGIAILVAILIIVHWTKPIFIPMQEIEESYPHIKFGNNSYKPRFVRINKNTGACFESDEPGIKLYLYCQHINGE